MSSQFKLMLVDDDDFIQSVIGESLRQAGYEVDFAQDGMDAWEKLQAKPSGYDLILLDKSMPRMDGISLLNRIKTDRHHSELLVVMLTGANQTDDVVEGLALGAYYYLIKPVMQDVLLRVVRNALQEVQDKRELRELLSQQKNNLHLLQYAKFEFRSLHEARDLALLLADASTKPERTVSGYSELLVNAVEHGNLGITYTEKGLLLGGGFWADEVERRLLMPRYSDRIVQVLLERKSDAFVVTIRDQGEGFEWQNYLEFDPARAFDLHGRGIAKSKCFCFSSLEYVEKGKTVVATIKL